MRPLQPAILIRAVCNTDGNGLWSDQKKKVRCTSMRIGYLDQYDGKTFGELRAYFNTDDWMPSKDGLIYTDKRWMREFRSYLQEMGLSKYATRNVDYSEQGMQGRNYVSMDFGGAFYNGLNKVLQVRPKKKAKKH